MTNTITKTRRTTECQQRKEIIRQSQDESEEGKEDEERDGCSLSLMGKKIGRKELIESERERFGVELTMSTRVTRGAKTNEVIGLMRISLKTSTIGETLRTTIELII
jgi:hypothetical protein